MSKLPTLTLPNSWDFSTWPSDVFPFNGSRGRHVVRQNQSELLAAGALVRPGRSIVILGAGYAKWLASKAARVTEFDVPANRPAHAHKRFGRARDAA